MRDKHFFDELHHKVRNSTLAMRQYIKSLPTKNLRDAAEFELKIIDKAMRDCALRCSLEDFDEPDKQSTKS